MYDRGIIEAPKLVHTVPQDDRYLASNTRSDFASEIQVKGVKGAVFRAKGTLIGTTYSGHPTCTTLSGTLRNLLYHLFAIHRTDGFSFDHELGGLPLEEFEGDDGPLMKPRFFDWLEVIRKWVKLRLAGDDTAAFFRILQDSERLEVGMQTICALRQ